MVAPFAGAWIEINHCQVHRQKKKVAPFAGAWIEISESAFTSVSDLVAPFAGAWIEINSSDSSESAFTSLPSRERGLK